ncbi:ATP-binding protein [Streptomyces sp. NPDC048637]|uniref:ATP-binding protein n=1 Tax=Streptomyces sp. NPDC048637 TaxID=3155636 RepID=UPI0034395B74
MHGNVSEWSHCVAHGIHGGERSFSAKAWCTAVQDLLPGDPSVPGRKGDPAPRTQAGNRESVSSMTVKTAAPRQGVSAAPAACSPTLPDHPTVVGGVIDRSGETVLRVPADLGCMHRARKLVVQAARSWGVLSEASLGDVELCAGEVVANAMEHTGAASVVRVSATTSGVRVEVVDTHPQLPGPAPSDAQGESGRGLLLVDALATVWGAHPTGTGKTVWFEIAADPQPAGCEALGQADRGTVGQRPAA